MSEMSKFDDFWSAWPSGTGRKKNRIGCEKKWRLHKLDDIAVAIIADVNWRKTHHKPWLDGFVPMPATYLNQRAWEDEKVDVHKKNSYSKELGVVPKEVQRAIAKLIIDDWPEDAIARNFRVTPQQLWDIRSKVKGLGSDQNHPPPTPRG